jgi:hypothetical protein
MYANFINSDNLNLIKKLFSRDNTLAESQLSDDDIQLKLDQMKSSLDSGILKIAVVFDDNDEPYAMRSGFYIKKAGAWYLSATKLLHSENHYNITARNIAPGLDLLIKHMENLGYYKFWNAGPAKQQDLRTKIMCKYSTMLGRYNCYDEMLIPTGKRSSVDAYEVFRNVSNKSDVMIKLFVLKQEERTRLIKEQYELIKNVE